jgi:acetylornithine/LysW-gamma-L-lysine aminotransferase
MAGHGVANLGHAHPVVARAIAEQAGRLITCHEAFYNDRRAAAVERLARLCPGLDRVYLCNSGTEAVEGAIKFARLSTGRPGIVAAMRGFHGRTMGSLSATWNRHYREPFEPLVPAFRHVPFNQAGALETAVDGDTAAVLLEVVQG